MRPIAQLAHEVVPADNENWPAPQATQEVAAVLCPNMPAAHGRHPQLISAYPFTPAQDGPYEPSVQAVHEAPAIETYPREQVVQLDDPGVEVLPDGHSWHTTDACDAAK